MRDLFDILQTAKFIWLKRMRMLLRRSIFEGWLANVEYQKGLNTLSAARSDMAL